MSDTITYCGKMKSKDMENQFVCETVRMLEFWGIKYSFYLREPSDFKYYVSFLPNGDEEYNDALFDEYSALIILLYDEPSKGSTYFEIDLFYRCDSLELFSPLYELALRVIHRDIYTANQRLVVLSLLEYFSIWFYLKIEDCYDEYPEKDIINFSSRSIEYKNEILKKIWLS